MLKHLAILAIVFYRKCISPLMLPRCRFYPSCAAYTEEALRRKGFWPGLGLACRRLLRCHPFSRTSGYDPVQ